LPDLVRARHILAARHDARLQAMVKSVEPPHIRIPLVRTVAYVAIGERPPRLFGSELPRGVSHLTLMFFDKDSQVFAPRDEGQSEEDGG
jgi:hypothetical protein